MNVGPPDLPALLVRRVLLDPLGTKVRWALRVRLDQSETLDKQVPRELSDRSAPQAPPEHRVLKEQQGHRAQAAQLAMSLTSPQ